MEIQGTAALVTGGASGLGLAAAERLAAAAPAHPGLDQAGVRFLPHRLRSHPAPPVLVLPHRGVFDDKGFIGSRRALHNPLNTLTINELNPRFFGEARNSLDGDVR